MFVRSKRLFLRPFWPEDWQEILSGIAEPAIVRNLARAPWPYTEDHARAFAAQQQDESLPHFAITLPSRAGGARLIGCVGLSELNGEANLGYWLARPYWGRGFATEAARALLSLARVLGHRRITGRHTVDNPASGRVLRKLGFRPTGEVSEQFSRSRGAKMLTHGYALDLSGIEPDGGNDDPGDFDLSGYMTLRAA